jgi:CelD/BcsL family acetyltransferase involved in cellulose biosynthesis
LADVENYENYYSSLSKNARQNLRTAYNRLNRDGKVIEFKFNRHLTNGQFNEIMELYVKRHEQRYGINTGSVKKWYLKHTNYSSKSLRKHINAAHAMLYVDGELAGFMSGYLKDKRWIIPRLSINSDYKFYSPGIILIDNVIKYMFENGLTILDLAKGDEPYKFQMGGECVKSYKFKM